MNSDHAAQPTDQPHIKRVLITGGVHRLGLHIAYAFATRGARLGLNYHSATEDEAHAAKQECERLGAESVVLLPGDITREPAEITERFVKVAGHIDVLVNNAGVMPHRETLESLEVEEFERTLALNLVAPLAMSKAAVTHMPTSGGAIVNLASLGGVQIWKERIPYNVSKSALITLTKALARELAPRGITVNAVAPGAIQVDSENAKRMGIAADKIPMGIYGNPGDIARAVLFFAYDAPYVTGQTLVVDGGRSLV
jgi:NAD(P)-dependent dehydrogenase (short-subunit alcohol dehydrogenase family)